MELSEWSTVVAALLGGAVTGPLSAWLAWRRGAHEIRSDERRQALDEWVQIASARESEIKTLEERVDRLSAEHTECLVSSARMSVELSLLRRDFDRLMAQQAEDSLGIWVISGLDGVILDMGGRCLSMLGYRDAELIGKPIDLIIPERLRERHRQGLRMVQAGNPIRRGAVAGEALRKDGTSVPVVVALQQTTYQGDRAIRAWISEMMLPSI